MSSSNPSFCQRQQRSWPMAHGAVLRGGCPILLGIFTILGSMSTSSTAFSPCTSCSPHGVALHFQPQPSSGIPCLVVHSAFNFGLEAKPRQKADKETEQKEVLTPEEEALMALDATLSTKTTNCPTWNTNVAAVVLYKTIYNNTNIPTTRSGKNIKYPNLGAWVRNLRRRRTLTPEQIQDLESIGLAWRGADFLKNEYDRRWDIMYEQLLDFKEEYGHSSVSITLKDHKRLAEWVQAQRQSYGQGWMPKHRIQKLEAIGFVWRIRAFKNLYVPTKEKLWQDRYQELLGFHQEFGHCNVPHSYKKTHPSFERWVRMQRVRRIKGLLPKKRQKLLEEIGFVWDATEGRQSTWAEEFEKIKNYLESGRPFDSISEGMVYYRWISKQRDRNARGVLEPERKAMLDAIGFDWKEGDVFTEGSSKEEP